MNTISESAYFKMQDELVRLRAEVDALRSANSSLAEKGLCRAHADPLMCEQAPCNSCVHYLTAERDRLRELLREASEDVENRKAFCLLISNAQGVGEYTREHTARLAERKKALLVKIDAALGGEGKDDAA